MTGKTTKAATRGRQGRRPMALGRRVLLPTVSTMMLAGAAAGFVSVAPTDAPIAQPARAGDAPAPARVDESVSSSSTRVDGPASLSRPLRVGAQAAGLARAVPASSASEIPGSALAAYQRAESIIVSTDASCGLQWQLLAAIGDVESNHGRFGGSSLNADGVATPAILGPRLTGKNDTRRITDTDGGEYDGDATVDRAVGPMQFIPSTWSVVGVDADGDGVRDPQDIDDAALAAAVYLCSGTEDLSTDDGLRKAVFRYNRSQEYVGLVLSLMRGYQASGTLALPDSQVAAGYAINTMGPDAIRAGLGVDAPRKDRSDRKDRARKNGRSEKKGADQALAAGASIGPKGTRPSASGGPSPSAGWQPGGGTSPSVTITPTPGTGGTSDPTPSEQPTTPTPSEQPTTPTPSEEPTTPTPSEEPTATPSEEPTEVPPFTAAEADPVAYQQCQDLGIVDDPATPDDEVAVCAIDPEAFQADPEPMLADPWSFVQG